MIFKTEPFDHQMKAFERLKNEKYFALFMEMGLGKTKIAIDIAVHKYEKGQIETVLVIAPNMVHAQWADEQIPEHCSIPFSTFVWSASKIKRRLYASKLEDFMIDERKLRFFCINVETFSSDSVIKYIAEYVKNYETFIIIDESTRIKNPMAKRTKIISKLYKFGQRCILTGTPVTKSPFDLYAPFSFLKRNFFDCNYFIFKHRYGVMMKGINPHNGKNFHKLIDEKQFSIIRSKITNLKAEKQLQSETMDLEYILTDDDYDMISALTNVSVKNVKFIENQESFARFKRLDELKAKIEPYTFSYTKKDLRKDLLNLPEDKRVHIPEKVFTIEYVQMSKEQRKVYDELRKYLLSEYADKELSVQNKVSLTIRLRQVTGGYFPYMTEAFISDNGIRIPYMKPQSIRIGKSNIKIDRIQELIEETSGESIIIWASFRAEVESLFDELSKFYSCEKYYGKTSKNERARIKDDFQKGKFQIMIANPSTAGYGLNLQRSTLQLWFSNSFRTEDRLQGEERSPRIGSVADFVTYKDIICKNSIDEKIYKVLREGRELNDYFSTTSLRDILQEDENESFSEIERNYH